MADIRPPAGNRGKPQATAAEVHDSDQMTDEPLFDFPNGHCGFPVAHIAHRYVCPETDAVFRCAGRGRPTPGLPRVPMPATYGRRGSRSSDAPLARG